jgi:Tol biopolymer transport system component
MPRATFVPENVTEASPSGDGNWLAFVSGRNQDDIFRRQLTEAADEMWYPMWRPDGKRVAASDTRARTTSVFDPTLPWNASSTSVLLRTRATSGWFR